MNSWIGGIIRVAVAAVVWGVAYPLTKLALVDTPPMMLGFLRFFLAGMVFVVTERSLPLSGVEPNDRRCFFKLAFWGVFVLTLGMNYGLVWAPGIVASLLSGTPPLFTVILAAVYLKESLQKIQVASIPVAILGLALLSGDFGSAATEHASWKIWTGCLLTLVPQFAWAMYGIIGKRLSDHYHWRVVCRDTFMLGAAMLLPAALIETALCGWGTCSNQALAVLAYLVFMNSVLTYSLWNSALKLIPVSVASFLIYLQPVSGAVLSYFLFGEKLGLPGAAGAMLIFVALTMVLIHAANKKSKR